MVIEQGTILDSVEYNIERTADAMEGAVKELEIAQGYVVPLCSLRLHFPLFHPHQPG